MPNRTRTLTPAEAARCNGGPVGWTNQRYVVAYRCPFCGADKWRHVCQPPTKGLMSHDYSRTRYC